MRWWLLLGGVGWAIGLAWWWRSKQRPISEATLRHYDRIEAQQGVNKDRAPWDWSHGMKW